MCEVYVHCLCVRACVCSCAAAFICVCTSQVQRLTWVSSTTALHLTYTVSLTVSARLTKQQAPRSSCFCPHSTRVIGLCHQTQLWCRCWGSKLRSSCLYGMYFTHWAIPQALQHYLRFNIIDEIFVLYI